MQEQTNGNDRRPGDMWTIEPCLYGRCNPSGAMTYLQEAMREAGVLWGHQWKTLPRSSTPIRSKEAIG